MKKNLLFLSVFVSILASSQYSSGTVSLGTSGATVKLEVTPSTAKLILIGSSTKYLSMNFTDDGMSVGSDGFIYSSASSTDYTFNGVGVVPSTDAQQDWTIVSNVVTSGTRTLTATRTLAGGSGDYLFSNAAGSFTFAWAIGGTLSLANHGGTNRGYVNLNMVFDATLSTKETKSNKEYSIFPNPAGDFISINNKDEIKSIKIIDSTGKEILFMSEFKDKMDISSFIPGNYFVEIISKSGTKKSEKIIKK